LKEDSDYPGNRPPPILRRSAKVDSSDSVSTLFPKTSTQTDQIITIMMILFLFCSTSIESYKVFQNNCGAWIGKNSLPPFGDNVPHYTTPNITSSRRQVSNIIYVIHCLLSIFKNSQDVMLRVYPTKTTQNVDNTVWLINLTSLIPVIYFDGS
jgi:hypothetical protein